MIRRQNVKRTAWITLGFALGLAVAVGVTALASRVNAQAASADATLLELLKISQKTYDGLAQMYLGDLDRLAVLQQIYQAERELVEQGSGTKDALDRIYRSQ